MGSLPAKLYAAVLERRLSSWRRPQECGRRASLAFAPAEGALRPPLSCEGGGAGAGQAAVRVLCAVGAL